MLVHAGAGGATLSFQIDALDDLERPGREAGVEVEIVGETYGRTALISAPDGPRVWGNERQRDFLRLRTTRRRCVRLRPRAPRRRERLR